MKCPIDQTLRTVGARNIAMFMGFAIGIALALRFPDLRGGWPSILMFVLVAPALVVLPLAAATFFVTPRLGLWQAVALSTGALALHSAVATCVYAARLGTWRFDDLTYTLFVLEWLIKVAVLVLVFCAAWASSRRLAGPDAPGQTLHDSGS